MLQWWINFPFNRHKCQIWGHSNPVQFLSMKEIHQSWWYSVQTKGLIEPIFLCDDSGNTTNMLLKKIIQKCCRNLPSKNFKREVIFVMYFSSKMEWLELLHTLPRLWQNSSMQNFLTDGLVEEVFWNWHHTLLTYLVTFSYGNILKVKVYGSKPRNLLQQEERI